MGEDIPERLASLEEVVASQIINFRANTSRHCTLPGRRVGRRETNGEGAWVISLDQGTAHGGVAFGQ